MFALSPKALLIMCSRSRCRGSGWRAAGCGGSVFWGQERPIKAGKSKFIWYAIAFTGIVTAFLSGSFRKSGPALRAFSDSD